MLLLLPPSETKRAGGRATPLDLEALALPVLRPLRDAVLEALEALSTDAAVAARVLKLGATQHAEAAQNAIVRSAPTMAAIERYTGVLYDALDAASLPAASRRWLGANALIHTAPFGPVGALDRIPAYRLGAAASIPGLPPLRRVWARAVTDAISTRSPSFALDMRSEAYVALGPVPESVESAYVRVVADRPDGTVRALSHFNKHAKGELARRLALDRPPARSLAGLLAWADERGIALRRTDDIGVIELVVG